MNSVETLSSRPERWSVRWVLAWTLALGSGLAAGCSSPDAAASVPAESFQLIIEDAISQAELDPAVSDEQLERLERAKAAGELTFAEYKGAYEDMDTCLAEAGITTSGVVVLPNTIPPTVTMYVDLNAPGLTDEQNLALSDACDASEVAYVSWVYSAQPTSVEAYWSRAEGELPRIKQCLLEAGLPADEVGETVGEVIDSANLLMWEDPSLNPYGVHNCFGDLPFPTTNWPGE